MKYLLDTDHLSILQRQSSAEYAKIVARYEQAASTFANLKASKVQIATMDLRIASIAISRGLKLVTRNSVDFSRVPGLQIEDWTK